MAGGNFTSPSASWFSLNNSDTVKTGNTGILHSIQKHIIRNIRPKLGIPNLPQTLDIGQNTDGGISDFRISAQILITEWW